MKVNVMYRAQCLAAYLGYGPDFDAENITEPSPEQHDFVFKHRDDTGRGELVAT